LDETLSQDMVHIDNFLFWAVQTLHWAFFSHVSFVDIFYLTQTIPPFSSFLSFLVNFNKKLMQVCEDIMSPRSWESIQGLLARRMAQL
jgi:hypothetical protein